MRIDAGRMMTEAMMQQKSKDFIRLVIEDFTASGFRIQAKLDAKAAQDPTWADVAQYHRDTMQRVLGDD